MVTVNWRERELEAFVCVVVSCSVGAWRKVWLLWIDVNASWKHLCASWYIVVWGAWRKVWLLWIDVNASWKHFCASWYLVVWGAWRKVWLLWIDVNASWKHVCACVVSCSVGCMTQGMVTVNWRERELEACVCVVVSRSVDAWRKVWLLWIYVNASWKHVCASWYLVVWMHDARYGYCEFMWTRAGSMCVRRGIL